jgi:nucleoporin POM152
VSSLVTVASFARPSARMQLTRWLSLSMVRALRFSSSRLRAEQNLRFTGKAPFKASYTLAKGSQPAERHQLASIQSRADLTLYTGSAGHHTYHFTGVGDSLYTDPDADGLVAPTSGRRGVLRLEQDVFPLPSASFLHGPKHGFCVNDALASRSGDDLILKLEGQSPFEVEIEVREEGHRSPKTFTIPGISTKEWPLVLPFDLHTPSAHSISIRRVQDANGCVRLVDSTVTKGAARTSLSVPVAEIASIAPVLPSIDACVGDFLEYVVQGAPPFTVKYSFEGKERSVPLSTSKFTRLAAEPGEFKIVSVGHGQDQCRSNEVNLYVV